MVKDDRVQVRLNKGTKLVLGEYCKNRGEKGITVSKFIEDVLQDYFEKNGLVELLALNQVANKMFYFDGLSQNEVLDNIKSNDIYVRLIK